MDKRNDRKSYRTNGIKQNIIGTPLGIHDKNKIELCVGDRIRWYNEDCIILWNKESKSYWALISRSMWYGDDVYDNDSYGKGYELRMDDGARMKIEKIK